MLKKLLGINPQKTSTGSYIPSFLSLKMMTSSKSNFDGGYYDKKFQGSRKKILIICDEVGEMVMENQKRFSTGNHPVEMGLPMLHFLKAGFEIEIATATGKSAKIEMWAMPTKDIELKKLFDEEREKFSKPKSLSNVVRDELGEHCPYLAFFIPGGHGAMLGLPTNTDLKNILNWAHQNGRFILAICHGPAALLATYDPSKDTPFVFCGYKMAVFPDSMDKMAPLVGYIPGPMPWFFGEQLQKLGAKIVNKKADSSCFKDRKLITGASPKAANAFGRLATTALIEEFSS